MHREIVAWTATPALPQPRDTLVRIASAAPPPGAAAGEVALAITLPGDSILTVGDLLCLLPVSSGGPVSLVRVLGDVVVDAAGRWTATGALD
jgi:hypothetical protein